MKLSGPRLDLPVDAAVRALARRHLDRVVEAHARLREGGDDAAVHDLRVALRRLRTTLRLYGPYLGDPVRRRHLRRLERIGDAAGPVSDLEAQRAWLAEGLGGWNAVEAVGRDRMRERVEARLPDAREELERALRKRLPRLADRLHRWLRRYRVEVDAEDPRPPLRVREAMAELVERRSALLRGRLERVRGPAQAEDAHRARIQARRLRYLLEPLRDGNERAASLVDALRRLQDLLGDLNDGEVMRAAVADELEAAPEEDVAARAGLLDLLERLRLRGEVIFGEVEPAWLGGGASGFFAEAVRLAAELRREPDVGVEIERKYLLRGMPDLPEHREVRIDQGWLPGERLQERLRRVTDPDGGAVRCYRTVKLGRGVRRTEVEEECSEELFLALWPLTEGRRVRKRRFRVPAGEAVWEIDRFEELDLVLAEIELPDPGAPVDLPPWLDPLVDREVTDDGAYVNRNLAR